MAIANLLVVFAASLMLAKKAAVAEFLLEIRINEFVNPYSQIVMGGQYLCCDTDAYACDDEDAVDNSTVDCSDYGYCDTKFTLSLSECCQPDPCGVQGGVIFNSPAVITNPGYMLSLVVQDSSVNEEGYIAARIKAEDDDELEGDELIDNFDANFAVCPCEDATEGSFLLSGNYDVALMNVSYRLTPILTCDDFIDDEVLTSLPTPTSGTICMSPTMEPSPTPFETTMSLSTSIASSMSSTMLCSITETTVTIVSTIFVPSPMSCSVDQRTMTITSTVIETQAIIASASDSMPSNAAQVASDSLVVCISFAVILPVIFIAAVVFIVTYGVITFFKKKHNVVNSKASSSDQAVEPDVEENRAFTNPIYEEEPHKDI